MRENISWNQLCAINENNDFTNFRKIFFVSIEFDKTFVRKTLLLITNELISRNIFSVRENFSFFHTVHCDIHSVKIQEFFSQAFLREINFCEL